MADQSFPRAGYNSRAVVEREHEQLVAPLGASGLVGDPTSTSLVYGDSSGMQVKVRANRAATIRGTRWNSGTSDLVLSIGANAGATRIDLVVLRLSRDTGNNATSWKATPVVVAGTSGSPSPSPTRQDTTDGTGVWETPLAWVTVGTGAVTITAGNVENVAPYVAADGSGLILPSVNALPYVITPHEGQLVKLADGTLYRYESAAWKNLWGWIDFTPLLYQSLTTTPASISRTIEYAHYRQLGKMVWANVGVVATAGSSNGVGIDLPVAAAARYFDMGTARVMGASPPATQTGLAYGYSGPPYNKLVIVSDTGGFLNIVSGQPLRYSVCYQAA